MAGVVDRLRRYHQVMRNLWNGNGNLSGGDAPFEIFEKFSDVPDLKDDDPGQVVFSEKREDVSGEAGVPALKWPKVFLIHSSEDCQTSWSVLKDRRQCVNVSGGKSRKTWLFPGHSESERGRFTNSEGNVGFCPSNINFKPRFPEKLSASISSLQLVQFDGDDEPFLASGGKMLLVFVEGDETKLCDLVKGCVVYKPLRDDSKDRAVAPLTIDIAEPPPTIDSPADPKGRTELYLLAESRDNWSEAVQRARALIASKANVNHRLENGSTPLIAAAHQGNTEMVRMLLSKRASPNMQSQGGHTAVHHASWNGNRECFRLLYGCEETLLETKRPLTARPVLDICKEKCTAKGHAGPKICWNFLIWERQKKHAVGQEIFEAIRAADCDEIRRLCAEHPEDLDTAVDERSGASGLHVGAEGGKQEAAHVLLAMGASVNATQLDGCTALHLAALRADTAMVTLLLDWNADPNVANAASEYPLHFASYRCHEPTLDLLYNMTEEVARSPVNSKHTKCVLDATEGPCCSCLACRRWKEEVWRRLFNGQKCEPSAGFHVCKKRLLSERVLRERRQTAELESEVEQLRRQLRMLTASDSDASSGKRPRGNDGGSATAMEMESEGDGFSHAQVLGDDTLEGAREANLHQVDDDDWAQSIFCCDDGEA